MLRVPHWLGDLAIALGLIALGLVWGWFSWRLGLGSPAEPGAGFFPLAISILVATGGVGCAVRALGQRMVHDDQAESVIIDSEALKSGLLIAALCLVFASAGFFVAGFAFLFLMLTWVGKVGPVRSLVVSLAIVLAFWGVFDRLLGVELPLGLAARLFGGDAG